MKRAHVVPSLVFGALTLATVGCSRPYFTWSPREPLASRRGRVAISVDDARQGDHEIVGRAFGVGGIPEDVRVGANEPSERLRRLLTEASLTAGIGLADPAETPSARVSLRLATMMCHGETSKAQAALQVIFTITDAGGSPRLAPETIALTGKSRGCKDAYYELFDHLLDEVAARLVEGPAHEAVLQPPEPISRTSPRDKPTAFAAAPLL